MRPLFFYGTLRHLPLLRAVLGHDDVAIQPARLSGFRVHHAGTESYPAISASEGSIATGLLFTNASAHDLARLDFYERAPGFDYKRIEVEVQADAVLVLADVYVPKGENLPGADWRLEDWAARYGAMTVRASTEMMTLFGTDRAETAARQYPIMLMRAASFERAQEATTPTDLRVDTPRGHVKVRDWRRPYSNYFGVAELDLSYPQFDGRQGPVVTRAALASGDAATVLPYDPVRDRVLLIEQFRFGVFVRGDAKPWLLEPPAGRIDPGETPAEAAARELHEEASITGANIIEIGRYYPSPAALSEYIFSFVALCDLPDEGRGTGGLAEEQEDIRTHVIPFADAMALLESGEADCGPLIMSLQWLDKHRPRLRQNG